MASVHLAIDGGHVSGETVNWYYSSGATPTTLTDAISGSTYEATKSIPLSGGFTYVRADVRSSTGALLAFTQPIFFESVSGLPDGMSVHIDSVLEYNEDPGYMADLALYRLSQEERERFEAYGLSAREVETKTLARSRSSPWTRPVSGTGSRRCTCRTCRA